MSNIGLTTRLFVLFTLLLVVFGCSPSSSEPSAKIGGMTAGEYREKAELSREVPSKTKGRVK